MGCKIKISYSDKGKIVANIDNSIRVSEETLGLYMLGVKKEEVSINEE